MVDSHFVVWAVWLVTFVGGVTSGDAVTFAVALGSSVAIIEGMEPYTEDSIHVAIQVVVSGNSVCS